jgi:putative N6-adenine-specific DNA methylase
MSGTVRRLAGFAVAAPGLEPWLARELGEIGVDAREEPGGAAFVGPLESVYRANLWSRLASRVVVRVAEFRVRALGELARRSGTVPWEEWLPPDAAVRVRATARKSRLYHTGAIAERVLEGMAGRVRVATPVAPGALDTPDAGRDEEPEDDGALLLLVRIAHDVCTISLDSSGALLHRRGYRQAVAKAPLRETLAAAMLAASGWRAAHGLADPMCGAGTIAIEAAMMARGMAPGLARRFAFELWPRHESSRWNALRDQARAAMRPAVAGAILASDRDAGAVDATRNNARRAGVSEDIAISNAPMSSAPLGPSGTWLVTNPPYGVRVGESAPLRDLYATLGRIARAGDHPIVMLAADATLERQLRLPMETVLATSNGGIPVRVRRTVGTPTPQREAAPISAGSP